VLLHQDEDIGSLSCKYLYYYLLTIISWPRSRSRDPRIETTSCMLIQYPASTREMRLRVEAKVDDNRPLRAER